jgi:hypothetical protein
METTLSEMILRNPRVLVAVEKDLFTGRLVQVIDALTEALRGVPVNESAFQLANLNWQLCTRTGGCLCDCRPAMKTGCDRSHQCLLSSVI